VCADYFVLIIVHVTMCLFFDPFPFSASVAQAALDAPRICLEANGKVALEEGISEDVVAELTRRGHVVHIVRGHARALFGRGQVIAVRHPTDVEPLRVLIGGSDGRADGCAMAS